jgi:hypothetical protein
LPKIAILALTVSNWATVKKELKMAHHLHTVTQKHNISKEALFDLEMARLRVYVEALEREGRAKANAKGVEYVPAVVYWDNIESTLRQVIELS